MGKIEINGNIYYSLIFLFAIIVFANISSADLGTFKQNQCVSIKTILNVSAVSISTISLPDSTLAISGASMTKNGQTFNYTFCDTKQTGKYNYDYNDSSGNTYVNSFTITPSGYSNGLGFFILIIVCIYAVAFFGFFGKNEWVSILGGLAMIGLGLFTINNGIDVFRNQITDIFSWTTIALGAIFALIAGIDVIKENM